MFVRGRFLESVSNMCHLRHARSQVGTNTFFGELRAVHIYPTYLKGAESIGDTYMMWIFHFGLQIEDSTFKISDFRVILVWN